MSDRSELVSQWFDKPDRVLSDPNWCNPNSPKRIERGIRLAKFRSLASSRVRTARQHESHVIGLSCDMGEIPEHDGCDPANLSDDEAIQAYKLAQLIESMRANRHASKTQEQENAIARERYHASKDAFTTNSESENIHE